MDPKIWGASAWWILHTAAAKAAHKQSAHSLRIFKEMAVSLECLLPCPSCRTNFQQHLATSKWPKSATGLPGWVFRLHTAVNKIASSSNSNTSNPKRGIIIELYSQECNINADHAALVQKAAPFLAYIEQTSCSPDAVRGFADGLHFFFDTPPVTNAALKSSRGFRKWLGVTALHVKSCSGTCTQKGGCGCDF